MFDLIINRNYVHKSFGAIGAVQLMGAIDGIRIDGTDLPESSIRALLNHGLQILQDAYAGADSAEKARTAFNDKLAKLLAGTLGTRNSSDPVESKMWELAEKAMRGKGLKGKELSAALDKFMADESNLAKVRPLAEAALKAESDLLGGLAD